MVLISVHIFIYDREHDYCCYVQDKGDRVETMLREGHLEKLRTSKGNYWI